ncbi:unnamed protein product [Brassica oleracea]
MFQQLTALCEARGVTILEACQSANPSPQPHTLLLHSHLLATRRFAMI